MPALKILDNIYWIDFSYNGLFLIEGSKKSAIIETAFPSQFNYVKKNFEKLGKKIIDFDYLIGTHIHHDHFGAVGHFLKENPSLKVIVQPKGTKHLIDPRKLNESAKLALGERFSLVGEMIPINPHNILNIKDRQIINLGNYKLELIYTPGHAKHHLIIFEKELRAVFSGDALANTYPGYPYVVVLPPPDYDYNSALDSINKIKSLNPNYLIQSHGGLLPREDHETLFNEVIKIHKIWLKFIKKLLTNNRNLKKKEFNNIFKKENPLGFTENEFEKFYEKYSHVPYMNYNGVKRFIQKSSN
ncbi:MAG: MBL fold metallo-hydrolase [Promethearchaeota archaeon]